MHNRPSQDPPRRGVPPIRHWTLAARLAGAMLGALLCGCATTELRSPPGGSGWPELHAKVPAELNERLAGAAPCCASLATLPYLDLPVREKAQTLRLREDTPVFAFDDGKSPFVAYRLPAGGRPLRFELHSLPVAHGVLDQLVHGGAPLVFAPLVLILDEQFRVQRRLQAGAPEASGCGPSHADPVFRLRFDIAEPPVQAAYLVIATSDALRAREGERVCGAVQHGYSPVGDLTLAVRALDLDDGALVQAVTAEWTGPQADPPSTWDRWTGRVPAGTLALGATRLHYVPHDASAPNPPRLQWPYERVAAADLHDDRILIDMVEPRADAPVLGRHAWRLTGGTWDERKRAGAAVVAALRERIRPDTWVETWALTAQDSTPEVSFRSLVTQDAQGRIRDNAMAAGVVAALPCGLCQTGACPPAVLAPCAALFAVGATLGGVWATGKELLQGHLKAAPTAAEPALGAPAQAALAAAMPGRLDAAALQRCLAGAAPTGEAGTGPVWRAQGRTARLTLAEGAVPPAPTLQWAAVVNRLSLTMHRLPGAADGAEELAVQMVVEGALRRTHGPIRGPDSVAVAWEGTRIPLPQWSEPATARTALQQACEGFAAKVLQAAQQQWRSP